MKTSDIILLFRNIEDAIKFAGVGEFRALKLMQRLDELGYDMVERQWAKPLPPTVDTARLAIAEAMTAPNEAPIQDPERDRLFND